jgi:hypothetical protein
MSSDTPYLDEILHSGPVVSNPDFTGYRYDLENQSAIWADGIATYSAWREAVLAHPVPVSKNMDPRSWFEALSQGQIGACQGWALADAINFAHYLATGEDIRVSPGWCYLRSQEADGLLGRDFGSTLNGGTKVAIEGVPLESEFPYVGNYGTLHSSYRSKRQSILSDPAKLFGLDGRVPLAMEEDCKKFLDTRSGVIQIGIPWSLPNQWEITSARVGNGGGHSVDLVGFLEVTAWNPFNYGYLLKNSWGTSWGRDGYALLHPNVVKSLLSSRNATFIGRSKARVPQPSGPWQPDL